MGISRSFRYKKKLTGGRVNVHMRKRKSDLARAPANTKLVQDARQKVAVHLVRCRGGMTKRRAIRLDSGNFSWGSENYTSKTRILDVVYNSTNNELVRTKTLVKNAIVQIDAAPFRAYFERKYNIFLGKKGSRDTLAEIKRSKRSQADANKLGPKMELESIIADLFATGRIYACIVSRPGQSGRADGYILEGKELEFYHRKLQARKRN